MEPRNWVMFWLRYIRARDFENHENTLLIIWCKGEQIIFLATKLYNMDWHEILYLECHHDLTLKYQSDFENPEVTLWMAALTNLWMDERLRGRLEGKG